MRSSAKAGRSAHGDNLFTTSGALRAAGLRSICDVNARLVLASAVDAKADVLVTGDKDLLAVGNKAGTPITDPRGFWNLLRRAQQEDATSGGLVQCPTGSLTSLSFRA